MARVHHWMEGPKNTKCYHWNNGKLENQTWGNWGWKGINKYNDMYSCFLVWFCLAEVPVSMLIEDTDEFTMEQNDETKKE